ncbi:hypothetical protein GZL_04102 [Streptomyces sp. 769]|nr:hypothetical protein GZL_04102 [Streptomyces sp. 769]
MLLGHPSPRVHRGVGDGSPTATAGPAGRPRGCGGDSQSSPSGRRWFTPGGPARRDPAAH